MNKENDNVVGRLGSQPDSEFGGERMCSMSEETSGDESGAQHSEAEDQGFLYNHAATIATLGATFFATIIISLIVSRMWNEDEIKLRTLDIAIKFLQGIARLCGRWALECEQTYNEYVNALH